MIAFSCKDSGLDSGELSPTLRSMGHDGSHANAGGQVAVCFESRFARNGRGAPSEIVPPLKAQSGKTGKGDSAPLVTFVQNTRDEVRLFGGDGQTVGALAAEPGMKQQTYFAGFQDSQSETETLRVNGGAGVMAVRRLTPC